MNENISRSDALCRLAVGLVILVFAGAKLSRRSHSLFTILIACCGALKTAEGILRYCPLIAMRKRQSDDHRQPAATINPS